MYEFIPESCREELAKYIRRSVDELPFDINSVKFSNLRRVLFALHGYEGLKEKKVRRILIGVLPADIKLELVQSLKKESDDNDLTSFDYTLALISWRATSKVAEKLRDYFDIPNEYLPATPTRKSTHQIVQPIGVLGELFDYQEEIRSEINQFLASAEKASMVQLPTGSGKTRTAMSSLVDWLNQPSEQNRHVIWLAHTQELCMQASESFRKNWLINGTEEIELVELWADAMVPKYILSSGFWVVGYVKFVNAVERLKELGFQELVLVIDEAHKSIAPSLLHAIEILSSSFKVKFIGLSATPGRASSNSIENKQLSRLFSNNLITSGILGSDPIKELQGREILAPIKRTSLYTEVDVDLDMNEIGETIINRRSLTRLSTNKARNEQIVKVVEEQVKQGNKVIVFSCTVGHARTLSILLAKNGLVACAVDCEMSSEARKLAVMSFKKNEVQVLLNYGVFSTGLDVPDIGAVVITRPTTSIVLYSQMIGRGMRGKFVGGTNQCTIIDILDNVCEYGEVNDVYNYFESYWE